MNNKNNRYFPHLQRIMKQGDLPTVYHVLHFVHPPLEILNQILKQISDYK